MSEDGQDNKDNTEDEDEAKDEAETEEKNNNTREIKTYTLSNRSLAASYIEDNEDESKNDDKTEN